MKEQSTLSHFRRNQRIRNGADDGDGWTVGLSMRSRYVVAVDL